MIKQGIKLLIWHFARSVLIGVLVLLVPIGLGVWSYNSTHFEDSSSPISIKTTKLFAENDAFEKHRLVTQCQRKDYLQQTKDLCNDNSCVIYFIPGQAADCPTINATVDRKTGEVSLIEMQAQ